MRSLHLKAQGKARVGTWTGMSGAFDAEVKVAIGGNSQEGMKVLVKAGETTVRKHSPTKVWHVSVSKNEVNE